MKTTLYFFSLISIFSQTETAASIKHWNNNSKFPDTIS